MRAAGNDCERGGSSCAKFSVLALKSGRVRAAGAMPSAGAGCGPRPHAADAAASAQPPPRRHRRALRVRAAGGMR